MHFEAPVGLPLGAIAITLSILYTLVICLRYRKSIPLSHHGQAVPTANLPTTCVCGFSCCSASSRVIPLGTISISNIGARHLFIIVPLAWLLVALCLKDGLGWLCTHWPHPAARVTSVVLVAILPLNALATNVMIQSFMVSSGGRGLWSDALYTLADTLNTQ